MKFHEYCYYYVYIECSGVKLNVYKMCMLLKIGTHLQKTLIECLNTGGLIHTHIYAIGHVYRVYILQYKSHILQIF